MKNRRKVLRRGDIVWAELGNHPGSHVQSGRRPCVVINTNKSNGHVYTVIPGSCKLEKSKFPTHIVVTPQEVPCGLSKKTIFMAEQITTIDSKQIIVKVGHISEKSNMAARIKNIILRQLGLGA